MSALREQRRQILNAAVEGLLDRFDEDTDYQHDNAELGVVLILCEMEWPDPDEPDETRTGVPYWCSDDRQFVQHGLLAIAADAALKAYDE